MLAGLAEAAQDAIVMTPGGHGHSSRKESLLFPSLHTAPPSAEALGAEAQFSTLDTRIHTASARFSPLL